MRRHSSGYSQFEEMKEPVEVLVLEEQIIKFFDESDYRFDSADNIKTYSRTFISGDKNALNSQIGIEVFEDEELKSSCLIGTEGGETGIHGNTTLISYGELVVCWSNTVFKLTLPELNLEWKTVSDSATCFGINCLDEDYVVHGELEITRLDKEGKIVWKLSGRDIWTTAEAHDDFAVYDDYILATDWEYNRYKLDFSGNLLEDYKIKPVRNQQVEELEQANKWWEFWK